VPSTPFDQDWERDGLNHPAAGLLALGRELEALRLLDAAAETFEQALLLLTRIYGPDPPRPRAAHDGLERWSPPQGAPTRKWTPAR
jgi:hypothetical protein